MVPRNQDQIDIYLHEFSMKIINSSKFLRFEWLEQEEMNDVRRMLKHQNLEKFLNLTGNIYPNLVRVIFASLTFEGHLMWSHVKGVDRNITPAIWITLTGLKNARRKVGKANIGSLEDYNKIQFFRSCLRNRNSTMGDFMWEV